MLNEERATTPFYKTAMIGHRYALPFSRGMMGKLREGLAVLSETSWTTRMHRARIEEIHGSLIGSVYGTHFLKTSNNVNF